MQPALRVQHTLQGFWTTNTLVEDREETLEARADAGLLERDSKRYQQLEATNQSLKLKNLRAFIPCGLMLVAVTKGNAAEAHELLMLTIAPVDQTVQTTPFLADIADSYGRHVKLDPIVVLETAIRRFDFETKLQIFLLFAKRHYTGNFDKDYESVCEVVESLTLLRDMSGRDFIRIFTERVAIFFALAPKAYVRITRDHYGKGQPLRLDWNDATSSARILQHAKAIVKNTEATIKPETKPPEREQRPSNVVDFAPITTH